MDEPNIYPVYVDESYGPEAPILCVGGYVFEPSKAKQLSVEWTAMLARNALPHFHMSECNGEYGVFAHLSEAECDAVAREAIALTKQYSEYGFAIAVASEYYDRCFPPQLRVQVGTAYSLCLRECMTMTRRWADRTNFDGRFAFFIENGHKHADEANVILANYGKPGLRDRFRYFSHAFINKEDAEPLQCADILAWQTYSRYRGMLKGRPPRKDLMALLRDQEMVIELTPQTLREMAERLIERASPISYFSGDGAAGAMPSR